MNEPQTGIATLERADLTNRRTGLVQRSRHELHQIPITDRGDRSARWAGVQHGTLADTVVERAQAAGLTLTDESWLMSPGGERIFGELEIATDSTALSGPVRAADLGLMEANSGFAGFDPTVMGVSLGILSGNDGSWAMSLIVIARVLVCSNGLTVDGGHITCRRLHTTGIERDLPGVIDRGLNTYVARVGELANTRHRLLELDYTRQQDVDHVLVEAGRLGIMPWSAIGKVDREWRSPSHPEFYERNGWSLTNCFTEIGKQFNPVREIKTADRVRQLVIDAAPNAN
jgi:hypothetical protein